MRDTPRDKRPPMRTVIQAVERATRIRARQTRQPMTIDNCRSGDRCPGHWHALLDDGRLDSRLCGTCKGRVHLCVSRQEQREQVAAGRPVVFYRDVWPSGYVAMRARRQVLEGKAPPEVLRGMGWSVVPRS